VLSQNTTAPRRLTDAERKLAPPVAGAWGTADRRVSSPDAGDIVSSTPWRAHATSDPDATPEPSRAGPRNEPRDFVSQNNCSCYPGHGSIEQLTDVSLAGGETRRHESQNSCASRKRRLLQSPRSVDSGRADEEKRRKEALPSSRSPSAERETRSCYTPSENLGPSSSSPIEGRQEHHRPNYVTESGYTEDMSSRKPESRPTRRSAAAGDAQPEDPQGPPGPRGVAGTVKAEARTSPATSAGPRPTLSPDGRLAVATGAVEDLQGPWIRGGRSGFGRRPRVNRRAARRRMGPRRRRRRAARRGPGWLDARRPQPLVPVGARRLHDTCTSSTRRKPGAPAAQRTAGPFEVMSAELSRDKDQVPTWSPTKHIPASGTCTKLAIGGGPRRG